MRFKITSFIQIATAPVMVVVNAARAQTATCSMSR